MINPQNKNIEKTLKYAASKNLSVLTLGQLLTQKHDITPAEATQWMDLYRKQYPKLVRVVSQPECVNAKAEVQPSNTPPPLSDESKESNYRPSILNRSAVKSFALAISSQRRAGKFTRCSPEFIKSVEAEVEALLRGIGGADVSTEDDISGEYSFINCKRAFVKIEEQVNRAIRKIVLRRVKSQPSLGQTLK